MELRETVARAVVKAQGYAWAEDESAFEVADAILALPPIRDAEERIAELERQLEAWQDAAQYPR